MTSNRADITVTAENQEQHVYKSSDELADESHSMSGVEGKLYRQRHSHSTQAHTH